jgi:beta-galactosidase GanA
MYVGVDYYPEHWPRTRWATDVRLMRKAGFNVVRLAEFNWVQLRGAAALAGYCDWHLRKYAALTRHAYGKGVGWYLGAVMKEDAFYDQLIQCLLRDALRTRACGDTLTLERHDVAVLLRPRPRTETKGRLRLRA